MNITNINLDSFNIRLVDYKGLKPCKVKISYEEVGLKSDIYKIPLRDLFNICDIVGKYRKNF